MVVLLVAEGYGQVVCVPVYYLRVVSMFFFDKRIERKKAGGCVRQLGTKYLCFHWCVCCEKQPREKVRG